MSTLSQVANIVIERAQMAEEKVLQHSRQVVREEMSKITTYNRLVTPAYTLSISAAAKLRAPQQ
ncbi:MAG: hypothetical protein HQL94_03290 [Magnetococcales bacterium]|nr:hypothetical protein [Magnetococcales bacterium]MBF0438098.1 hypothetical protein [Magnetococcales bacterium]